MKRVKGVLAIVFIGLATALMAGCNTMHGLGEDISSGGKALSGAAKRHEPASDRKTTSSKITVQKVSNDN
jgi:entericidin B